MNKVLIVIDAQNDYLANGRFPLWNIEQTMENIKNKIITYIGNNMKVVFIKHLSGKGSPFFEEGSEGAEIAEELMSIIPDPIVIDKHYGNAFDGTSLEASLNSLGCKEIELCGMMTQNCVLFTAISNEAKKYRIKIYGNGCTTVSPILHSIAINGLSRIEGIEIV